MTDEEFENLCAECENAIVQIRAKLHEAFKAHTQQNPSALLSHDPKFAKWASLQGQDLVFGQDSTAKPIAMKRIERKTRQDP